METIATYITNGNEFELYISASNDYCVSVTLPDNTREDYNLGPYLLQAYEFILSYALVGDCVTPKEYIGR